MKDIKRYRQYYFFFYGAVGTFMPLFNLYLRDILSFNNTQVGFIASTAAIVAIFTQPLWGMIADYTKKPKQIMIFLLACSIILNLVFLIEKSFLLTFLNYFFFSFFFNAIHPLVDSLTFTFVKKHPNVSFGSIRSLGSIGFATLALAMGYITDITSIKSIFIIFGIITTMAIIVATKLGDNSEPKSTHFFEDLKSLLHNKTYIYLLVVMFLFVGTTFGSGAYLSLFIQEKGQSLTIIGLVYFLMAGLEMPFMLNADRFVNHFGAKNILLFIIGFAALRQLLMSFNLNFSIFFLITISQSLIIGLMLPTVITYISKLIKPVVFTTSISFYTAMTFGAATWLMTLFAGYLSDQVGYANMFRYMAGSTMISFILALFIKKKKAL